MSGNSDERKLRFRNSARTEFNDFNDFSKTVVKEARYILVAVSKKQVRHWSHLVGGVAGKSKSTTSPKKLHPPHPQFRRATFWPTSYLGGGVPGKSKSTTNVELVAWERRLKSSPSLAEAAHECSWGHVCPGSRNCASRLRSQQLKLAPHAPSALLPSALRSA